MSTVGIDAGARGRSWLARTPALLAALAIGLATGCAGPSGRPDAPDDASFDPGEMARIGQSPLADFGVGTGDIPEALQRALAGPYARPTPPDCATITAEVRALDAALGSDFDVVQAELRPDDHLSDAMAGAVRGLIPYRGVIGLLTGARQRARRVSEAVDAGMTRRGYLKGVGESMGCASPAAPQRAPPVTP